MGKKKEKNIFLTTISETRDRLDMIYFSIANKDSTFSYTTGISVAEAGIKCALSKHKFDEIIVLGDGSFCSEDDSLDNTVIADVDIDKISNLDEMSEYGFLVYRLKEFINQVDFEILDIGDALTDEEEAKCRESIKQFREEHCAATPMRDMYDALSADIKLANLFLKQVLEDKTPAEQKWIKHVLFMEMDSYYKIHMLSENKNTTIRFMPVNTKGVMTMESLKSVVWSTLDEKAPMNLYVDIQGMNAVDGNTLISTFLLFNNRIGYNCEVKELIKTESNPGHLFRGRVWNVRENYDIQEFMAGIEIFLDYGKDDQLNHYWYKLGNDDPNADLLFNGMDMVDEGISLCNIDLIAAGIDVIRNAINKMPEKESDRNIYLDLITSAIKADFGGMLEGDKLSIPELLKWSLRKGFYQQTLTIIESKIPEDIITRGIYYYAENDGDIRKFMKSLNTYYWNTPARMRYSFNDIAHQFIKFYGRSELDYRQKPDAVVKDYARQRVDLLKGPQGQLTRSFSQLHDNELLYELLLCYYQIGNLRNQVNHAHIDRAAVKAEGLVERRDMRDDLDRELGRFIELYDTACKKVNKTKEPVILNEQRFKGYARHHEIKPLEVESDSNKEYSYECSFDGREVLIRINMMETEKDEATDVDDEKSNENGRRSEGGQGQNHGQQEDQEQSDNQ